MKKPLALCFVLALMLGFSDDVRAQLCPSGSLATVDHDGNRVCQGTGSNRPAAQRSPATGCPNDSFPVIDSRGNKVCTTADGKTNANDAPRACPTGTFPGNDANGKLVCRSL